MIGGGVAGGILGALGGKMYVYAGDGIFRIPAMINQKELTSVFMDLSYVQLLHLLLQRLCHLFLQQTVKTEAEEIETTEKTNDKKETRQKIYAPVKGTAIPQDQIKDETFASGMLGKGVGIRPSESVVYAPFDGVISSVTETKHAVGMVSDQDVQLLIHIGIDTVKMNGEGFKVFVKDGQAVQKVTN
ncbi:MAG: PTS glucose transporter subunit IIA [Anaerostipes sp.]